jgi:hypothetical protein
VEINGHPPKGIRAEGKQTVFWEDLPAADTTVKLIRPETTIPFLPKATPEPPQALGTPPL